MRRLAAGLGALALWTGAAPAALAQAAPAREPTAFERFHGFCAATGARPEAVAAAAQAAGFTPIDVAGSSIPGVSKTLSFTRDLPDGRREVVMVGEGFGPSADDLPASPFRVCGLTVWTDTGDIAAQARAWVGADPVLDQDGRTFFSYVQGRQPTHGLSMADRAGVKAALESGDMKTLAVLHRSGAVLIVWIVFDPPAPPPKPK